MATANKTNAEGVDYTMQERIKALYELQKIDTKIDEINNLGAAKIRLRSLVAAMKK